MPPNAGSIPSVGTGPYSAAATGVPFGGDGRAVQQAGPASGPPASQPRVPRQGVEYRRAEGIFDEFVIDEWVAKRSNALRSKQFEEANEIRDALWSVFRVQICDLERVWYIGMRKFATHDYTRCPNDHGDVNLPLVNQLLAARLDAKISNEYTLADAFRAQLENIGVDVSDREKLWRVVDHELAHRANQRAPSYVSCMWALATKELRVTASAESYQQSCARQHARKPQQAQAPAAGLPQQQPAMDPSISPEEMYRRVASCDPVYWEGYRRDERDRAIVDFHAVREKVVQRWYYKTKRKFKEADKIRDELILEHGVVLHDTDKVWRVHGGRPGGFGPQPTPPKCPTSDSSMSSHSRKREPSDQEDAAARKRGLWDALAPSASRNNGLFLPSEAAPAAAPAAAPVATFDQQVEAAGNAIALAIAAGEE